MMLSKNPYNVNDETDANKWTPQYAGDGKLEMFSLNDVVEYTLNQLPNRKDYHITRLAQAAAPFALHFRDPSQYPSRGRKFHLGSQTELPPGLLYAMVDGEFYEIYRPKDICFNRKVTLKAIGSSEEKSKLVRDTIRIEGEDAAHMPPTMAGTSKDADIRNKVKHDDPGSYLAIPFKRVANRIANPKFPRIRAISDLFN